MVTGASDGIGKALAVHIAGLGAQVVLHGRNTKKLESVYDQITTLQDSLRPSIAVLDLATADADAYSSLVSCIEQEFGRLDGLVHNAGILVGNGISAQALGIYCSVLSPVSSSLSLPGSTIVLGSDSSGSTCSISFFGRMPSSTNLRAPGRTLRSSEPTARL